MAFNKKKFKDAMRIEGVTQKDLAEKFGVDIRTVNRWLDPKYQIPSEKVRDLCVAINNIPNEFDPDWEGSAENQILARVSAKVSSASKNGYWLMKARYGVSEKEIVELAPTLFALFAAAVFEGTNKGDNDQRKLAAEILAKEYGLIPESEMFPVHPDEIEEAERREKFIADGKIFGSSDDADIYYSSLNPFAFELEKFVSNSKKVALSHSIAGECPNSKGNALDIQLINAISDNDPEISEAISQGDIELFSKEFAQNQDKRKSWMKNRVLEVKKLKAEKDKKLPKSILQLIEKINSEGAPTERETLMKKWQISEN